MAAITPAAQTVIDRHPLFGINLFSDADRAVQAEIHQRLLHLAADIAPIGFVRLFDSFVDFGNRYNAVTTVEAGEALAAEYREVDRNVLATLRAGDLDAIRSLVHGSPFR